MIGIEEGPPVVLVEKKKYEELKQHYEKLLEKEQWLNALEAAGVDNWEGIEVALEIFGE